MGPESAGRTEWLATELARPEAFPRDTGPIEVRRTLVSLLVFTRERVYKLKQALDLGFIDSRTLARRRFLCDEEVRLDAALAPGVHLGVVPITRGPDGHLVGAESGSEADFAIYLAERAAFEPLDEVPAQHVLDMRSGEGAPEDQLTRILDLLIGFEAARR